MKTRIGKLLFGVWCLVGSAVAGAAELPFNQAAYEGALAAGQPLIVYVHADWCPTCKVQQPIVDRLAASPRFKDVTIFVADFDTQTALKKALRVTQQSTFVVFRHGKEVTRSTGETREDRITAIFEQAL